tara:strand:+ start:37 stop:549 length:513 start_codon:yes stop_codon:yes gene_type:complete
MNLKKLCCFLLFGAKNKNSYNYEVTRLNMFNQIRGSYSIFDYNKENDMFRYGGKYRRKYKRANYKQGLIEDHHIIPKQFVNHDIIKKLNFDVACSNNLLIMPSRLARPIINDENIIYHQGHHLYNEYVGDKLEYILSNHEYIEDDKYIFWLFFKHLETKLCMNDKSVPWN